MQTDPAVTARPANRYLLMWLVPVFVFAIVALARVVYVSLYGAALPFWDQWDELDRQIRPWFNGTWHFLQLFVPHGQHRIAFTRGISFLLASANRHVFDNLVEAYANVLIYACLWAMAYALLVRGNTSKARAWLVAIAIIALGALPFDWENTLVGFQNQFYLMELFAVVVIGIAAYRASSLGTVIAMTILALASVFTMGSGLLAAPAACIAVLMRAWCEPTRRRYALPALAALVLVTAFGLVLLLHSREHTGFGAQNFDQLITALLVVLMWPLQHPLKVSHWLFAAMLWAPSVIWFVGYCRNRRGDADEIFAFSLAVWVLLQCLAIAEARGHDLRFLPSRYSEIPAIGIAANLWLALKLVSRTGARKHKAYGVALACGVALVGWTFWQRTPEDLQAMQQRHAFSTVETTNVRHYFAGQPLPLLPEGSLNLPYPSAARLRDLLDSAEIRALLPPSAFPPSDPRRHAPLSALAAFLQRSVREWFPATAWVVSAHTLAVVTPSMFTPYPGPIPDKTVNTQCSLDAIDGRPAKGAETVAGNSAVLFQGWAGDGQDRPFGNGLFILKGTQGAYAAPLTTGAKRADVAKAFHNKAMAGSGFNLTAVTSQVPAGTYSLLVAGLGHPQAICDLHHVLIVQ